MKNPTVEKNVYAAELYLSCLPPLHSLLNTVALEKDHAGCVPALVSALRRVKWKATMLRKDGRVSVVEAEALLNMVLLSLCRLMTPPAVAELRAVLVNYLTVKVVDRPLMEQLRSLEGRSDSLWSYQDTVELRSPLLRASFS